MANSLEDAIYEFGLDPCMAHRVLFGHKHADPTPLFHEEIIRDWHSDIPNVLTMAFRGAAKSTLAEEAIALEACLQRTRNCVILGESEQRAVERLRSIKAMFEGNELLTGIFQIGPGDIWTEAKITLSNGCMLQSYGRGQSLRGVKHLEFRPDLIFMDDLEDKESVATPEARNKTLVWFTSTVMPAGTPDRRMRMAATPLNPEALAPTLAKASKSWVTHTYPIIHKDEAGEWTPTWPGKYSVEWALGQKAAMTEIGKQDEFSQEYMCEAKDAAAQTFTSDMIKVVPQVRSWHPVYAMYDPARTTNKKSATTGKVVWSWIGRKLVIWDASARKWMPDEIVKDIFDVDEEFSPVAIGVEQDGLEEFLLQPLRTEQVRRGVTIPLRPLRAPKGKLDFIRALQPYFRAGEVEFARDLPDLRDQLLGFPTGLIDAPNALAYALRMRSGLPVYDGFTGENVAGELAPDPRATLWLAINSDGKCTTAVLCQVSRGHFNILGDWLREGPPGDVLTDIVQEASLEAPTMRRVGEGKAQGRTFRRTPLRLVAPRWHFEAYEAIGLRAAARKIPVEVARGGDVNQGREEVRQLLRRKSHGETSLQVSTMATWSLRGLSGGYARELDGLEPTANAYRVLVEGVESFAGMLRGASVGELDSDRHYDYTPSGQRYLSARAR